MILWTPFPSSVHCRPPFRGSIMANVKQFTSLVSLSHRWLHALLIPTVALNMVMTLPVL